MSGSTVASTPDTTYKLPFVFTVVGVKRASIEGKPLPATLITADGTAVFLANDSDATSSSKVDGSGVDRKDLVDAVCELAPKGSECDFFIALQADSEEDRARWMAALAVVSDFTVVMEPGAASGGVSSSLSDSSGFTILLGGRLDGNLWQRSAWTKKWRQRYFVLAGMNVNWWESEAQALAPSIGLAAAGGSSSPLNMSVSSVTSGLSVTVPQGGGSPSVASASPRGPSLSSRGFSFSGALAPGCYGVAATKPVGTLHLHGSLSSDTSQLSGVAVIPIDTSLDTRLVDLGCEDTILPHAARQSVLLQSEATAATASLLPPSALQIVADLLQPDYGSEGIGEKAATAFALIALGQQRDGGSMRRMASSVSMLSPDAGSTTSLTAKVSDALLLTGT